MCIRDSFRREADLSYLLYKHLDLAIEEMSPVLQAYRERITWMDAKMKKCRRHPHKFEKTMDEVSCIREQLSMYSRLLRPVKSMISVMAQDFEDDADLMGVLHSIDLKGRRNKAADNIGIRQEITAGFALLEGHTEEILEDIQALMESVGALREEYNTILDRRMNDILYVLTMVTTVMVPMQTLSGIYGMNFVDLNNDPAMPELTWPHGYTFFWLLSCSLSLLILFAFRTLGWL
eukprot:TRINITY_DN26913_c0_g1_i1.p1 TRINITY_DN26913_c0_g1~~TRINITY_DN26913_c0_g1_i1.p1  ORF type:complete len:234 (+),score=64.45 TRINITY_DN26913_c0_g1_i1:130-831(+)